MKQPNQPIITRQLPWCLLMVMFMALPGLAQKRALRHAWKAATQQGFSGVALVLDNGQRQLYKAHGYRHTETGQRLKKTDIMELASLSKAFTAMSIMMLAERGLLHLDDSLGRYIQLPYPGITIRHLLTHTSGLPDYQAVMDAHWDKQQVAGNPDIIAYLQRYHPPALFSPGEQYAYSNTGYVMLGTIAEKASGIDFVQLLDSLIFSPLNMRSTAIRTLQQKAATSNFAAGHIRDSSGNYVNANRFRASDYTVWLGNRKGPGRVSSTAADLQRWDAALYTSQLVSDSMLRLAFSPTTLNHGATSNYGFGWVTGHHDMLGDYVMHTGDNPGYQNLFMRYVEQHKTIIVLNNNAHPYMSTLVSALQDALK